MVNIILAGYDKDVGPSLYFIDYIASLHNVDKAAFGYGSYFALSMMDRHYRRDMNVEEAIELVDKCIREIRSRLVVSPPNFLIKIVDKDGAREYAWRQSITDDPPVPVAVAAAWFMLTCLWDFNLIPVDGNKLELRLFLICNMVRILAACGWSFLSPYVGNFSVNDIIE